LGKRKDRKKPDSIKVLHRMAGGKTSTVHSQPSTVKKELDAVEGFSLQFHRSGEFKYCDLCFRGSDTAFRLTIHELDLDALNRGRRFLCQWKEIERNTPSGGKEADEDTSGQQNAHLEVLDRQADFVRVRIEGECLNGVHLARKIKLKGKESWLFWKQPTD
jgi:hypothetical protein